MQHVLLYTSNLNVCMYVRVILKARGTHSDSNFAQKQRRISVRTWQLTEAEIC